jgi:hypothetical protein
MDRPWRGTILRHPLWKPRSNLSRANAVWAGNGEIPRHTDLKKLAVGH